jgi:NAD(P) transhydrogenase
MAEQLEADLAVIGAGPAGQKGAIQGAKAGKKVVVIDRLGLLGGACLNQGTVPSKTLRATILDMTGFIQSAYHGKRLGGSRQISVEDLRSFMEKVIAEENQVLAQECAANGIVTAFGPRFTDPHTLEVVDAEQRVTYVVRAHKHLIATGSSPRHPLALPPDSEDIFVDSDIIFKMEKIPESLIVLGGGIIGCEYATMFAALGVKVTLVDRRNDLLRMLDGEIQKAFAEYISHIPDLSVQPRAVRVGVAGRRGASGALVRRALPRHAAAVGEIS